MGKLDVGHQLFSEDICLFASEACEAVKLVKEFHGLTE